MQKDLYNFPSFSLPTSLGCFNVREHLVIHHTKAHQDNLTQFRACASLWPVFTYPARLEMTDSEALPVFPLIRSEMAIFPSRDSKENNAPSK